MNQQITMDELCWNNDSKELLTQEEKEWIRWLIYPFHTSEITCIQIEDCNQPIEDETPPE